MKELTQIEQSVVIAQELLHQPPWNLEVSIGKGYHESKYITHCEIKTEFNRKSRNILTEQC